VVQEDAHLAVIVALVAERILDARNVARRRARKVVRSHCDRSVAKVIDLVVVEDNLRPALAAVDCEAGILLQAVLNHRSTDEIGHGRLARRPEGLFGGLGRFEEHVRVAIAVELASSIGSRLDVVTFFEVCLADGLDRVRPAVLGGFYVLRSDGCELDSLAKVVITPDKGSRRQGRVRRGQLADLWHGWNPFNLPASANPNSLRSFSGHTACAFSPQLGRC